MIACWTGKLHTVPFLLNRACSCLAHRLSLEWETITGDSWVVHTTPVTGAKGAGGYMAKYMRKEFDGERAETLGMVRRWSNSRGWPGPRRNRLSNSKAGGGQGFKRHVYRFGQVDEELVGLGNEEVLEKQFEASVEEKKLSVRRFVGAVKRSTK